MSSRASGIGTAQGVALYTGAVLGTGVLVLPGMAAEIAGPASILSWGLMIALSIPLASTFALLGARYPDAGGVFNFVTRAYGSLAGGITGWLFYGGVMLGTPSAAMMGGVYLVEPFGAGNIAAVIASVVMYGIAALAISYGIRASATLQLCVAGGLALTMILVIVISLPHASVDHLYPFAPHGWLAIGGAASLLMFAFVGWEAVSPMSSEFRDPKKAIPWATFWALLLTSALYLGLAVATVSVLDGKGNDSRVSLTALLSLGLGTWAPEVMAATAVFLTLGALLAYVGGGAKLGAALARDGMLPSALTAGHAAGQAPIRSLLVVIAFAGCVFLAMATFPNMLRFTLHASAACFTAVYAAGSAAAVVLLREHLWHRVTAASALILSCIPLLFSGLFILVPAGLALLASCFWYFAINRQQDTEPSMESRRDAN